MQSKLSKRKSLIIRAIVYIVMFATVVVVVTLITLFMLGFRFTSGSLERYAFLQFDSSPSGATVSIDGALVNANTPNKSSVPSGQHDIVMWREGYEKWTKTIDAKPGTLTWLNYAILVPSKLNVKTIKSYDLLYDSLASPDRSSIVIQKQAELPVFDLINLESDEIKSKTLTLPQDSYSESENVSAAHSFRLEKWDENDRYILINHIYLDKKELLVVDTQNIDQTKNITNLLDIEIDKIEFADKSGNNYYILSSNDVRKIDLSAGTISRPLISKVADFSISSDAKVIAYKSLINDKNLVDLGIYQSDDDLPFVVRTAPAGVNTDIIASHYFNKDYVAILIDKDIELLGGEYPDVTKSTQNNLKSVSSFSVKKSTYDLSFSPNSQYVMAQSGLDYTIFDIEYQGLSSSSVSGVASVSSLKWLDDNYLWSDRDDTLAIREFDGQNLHIINPVLAGQDVIMTKNGRYIYSLNKNTTGYQLQRVQMIIQ